MVVINVETRINGKCNIACRICTLGRLRCHHPAIIIEGKFVLQLQLLDRLFSYCGSPFQYTGVDLDVRWRDIAGRLEVLDQPKNHQRIVCRESEGAIAIHTEKAPNTITAGLPARTAGVIMIDGKTPLARLGETGDIRAPPVLIGEHFFVFINRQLIFLSERLCATVGLNPFRVCLFPCVRLLINGFSVGKTVRFPGYPALGLYLISVFGVISPGCRFCLLGILCVILLAIRANLVAILRFVYLLVFSFTLDACGSLTIFSGLSIIEFIQRLIFAAFSTGFYN